MTMFTPNQLQLLAILAEDPRREYHFQELGRRLGKKPGVFQRGIDSLERHGWLVSRRQGNLRLFKFNEAHPLSGELKAIVRKTAGIEADLKKLVIAIKGVKTALIYGSYAKGGMRPDSDVDLLIIADSLEAEDELIAGLSRVEEKLGREVNYKLYREPDFKRRRKADDPFLAEVLSGRRILLKGDL